MPTNAGETNDEEKGYTYRCKPSERMSEAVITAITTACDRHGESEVADETPSEAVADPIYDAVDPDALDALFRSTPTGARSDGRVTFDYADYEVTVHGDGVIRLRPYSERRAADD